DSEEIASAVGHARGQLLRLVLLGDGRLHLASDRSGQSDQLPGLDCYVDLRRTYPVQLQSPDAVGRVLPAERLSGDPQSAQTIQRVLDGSCSVDHVGGRPAKICAQGTGIDDLRRPDLVFRTNLSGRGDLWIVSVSGRPYRSLRNRHYLRFDEYRRPARVSRIR